MGNAPVWNRGKTWLSLMLLPWASTTWSADYFKPVPNGQFLSVCFVQVQAWNDGKLVGLSGTGILLSPDIVLTAAHVIASVPAPDAIQIVVSDAQGRPWRGRAVAYRSHPSYLDGLLHPEEAPFFDPESTEIEASDMALVRLERPCPIPMSYPSLGAMPTMPGTPVTAVGFGRIEGPSGSSPAKRFGTLEFFRLFEGAAIFKTPDGSLQRANHGDSGGPLFLGEGDSLRVVAITQGSLGAQFFAGQDQAALARFATVDRNRIWLDATRKELQTLAVPPAPAFYLKRQPVRRSCQLALTARQMAALLSVELPIDRLFGQYFARGVNEPIPGRIVQAWAKTYQFRVEEYFVVAQYAAAPAAGAK